MGLLDSVFVDCRAGILILSLPIPSLILYLLADRMKRAHYWEIEKERKKERKKKIHIHVVHPACFARLVALLCLRCLAGPFFFFFFFFFFFGRGGYCGFCFFVFFWGVFFFFFFLLFDMRSVGNVGVLCFFSLLACFPFLLIKYIFIYI